MNKLIEEVKANAINDFNDYMDEENQEISNHVITNECYINNYISSIHYLIVENTENMKQVKEVEKELYKILNNYCNNNF